MKQFQHFFLTAAILFSAVFTGWAAAPTTTLTIISPTAKLRVSNDVFTVSGIVVSKTAVSNVLYSLNNSAWTNAVTANGWSNWSAQVTLTPGTNAFAAYAVDINGKLSKTNTVRFVYVVMGGLTVHTNGNGSVSPNYNGAVLQLGVNYSMTARPPKGTTGFGLQTWTDGSNNVVTNNATLRFMMVSNLTLTANFGDVARPLVTITSSVTNANGNLNSLTVSGIASDNVAVANVAYRLNYGSWISVTNTINNWTNWTFNLSDLQPGPNDFKIQAVDTSSNLSLIIPMTINNNTAPAKLSGLSVIVKPDDTDIQSFSMAFGLKTFTEVAHDPHNVNGAGSYIYKSLGGSASLTVKYTAPPIAASAGSRNYGITFLTPYLATYSTTNFFGTNVVVLTTNNTVVTTNLVATNVVTFVTGYMYFKPAAKLAIASPVNQLFFNIASQASNSDGIFFQKGNYTAVPLTAHGTNNGSYTYSVYSPISGLFKLTDTNGTDYILATFENTNYGSYYSESYNPTGHTNGTDSGRFMIGAQTPGGNAPFALTNRAFQIFSGEDSFKDAFGASTYSQETSSTNFDNAVGSYTYNRPDTNIGQLNLTVTAPPTLAGSNNIARLIFVANNLGLFTNEDSTISSFVMTTITNLAPASITNTTLAVADNSGGTNQIAFASDGSFTLDSSPAGTYLYSIYSPVGVMIQLDINSTNFNFTARDWVQLNFKTTNSGTAFVNLLDTNNVPTDSFSGTFKFH